jgi:hypothetical protein
VARPPASARELASFGKSGAKHMTFAFLSCIA